MPQPHLPGDLPWHPIGSPPITTRCSCARNFEFPATSATDPQSALIFNDSPASGQRDSRQRIGNRWHLEPAPAAWTNLSGQLCTSLHMRSGSQIASKWLESGCYLTAVDCLRPDLKASRGLPANARMGESRKNNTNGRSSALVIRLIWGACRILARPYDPCCSSHPASQRGSRVGPRPEWSRASRRVVLKLHSGECTRHTQAMERLSRCS